MTPPNYTGTFPFSSHSPFTTDPPTASHWDPPELQQPLYDSSPPIRTPSLVPLDGDPPALQQLLRRPPAEAHELGEPKDRLEVPPQPFLRLGVWGGSREERLDIRVPWGPDTPVPPNPQPLLPLGYPEP